MEQSIILMKAGIRRYRGSFAGIFLLLMLVSLTLAAVLTVWINADGYIPAEIERAGFGELTAWVSDVPDSKALQESILDLDGVGRVETQSLIYADYEADGQESDSEGQLIVYRPEEGRYRFFNDRLDGYRDAPRRIRPGEVYISPSLISMMNIQPGDQIVFPVARNGETVKLTVAGYYEDPFMGSSLIGMKGFLIAEADYDRIQQTIGEAKINALAEKGAMLHVFAGEAGGVNAAKLNEMLNEETQLPLYTEFIHSRNAIAGFMLLLQNAFGGFFLAFALVLLGICLVILGHSIQAVTEQEYGNLGILKTMGMSRAELVRIQLLQYLTAILSGMLCGILLSRPLGGLAVRATVTVTGVLVPNRMPVFLCTLCFLGIIALLTGFSCLKLRKPCNMKPLRAIRGETDTTGFSTGAGHTFTGAGINGGRLTAGLALRQLAAGRRRYLGTGIVAVLLALSVSLVGRMDSWLGPDGRGMMDAFHPADHDIGVQTTGRLTAEEAEHMVLSYTDITDSYLLAMPDVSVNGVNFTANVITEPERFHMIEGQACTGDGSIVLTESAAQDLGASVGDTVSVRGGRGTEVYRISGIF